MNGDRKDAHPTWTTPYALTLFVAGPDESSRRAEARLRRLCDELAVEKVPTGISGLDSIALGGLPRGSSTLVTGTTGTGTTLFAIEFLAAPSEASMLPGCRRIPSGRSWPGIRTWRPYGGSFCGSCPA